MRLFVAIEVPEVVRDCMEGLRREHARTLPPGRWVRGQNLHLTLDFLGEQEERRLPQIGDAIESLASLRAPLELVIGRPGTFPPRRPAKVIWVGFEPEPALLALQAALSDRLDEVLGRAPAEQPFHPHLTLARARRPWPRQAVERWASLRTVCAGQAFQVTYIDLMESRLSPSGPTYRQVRRFPLEG